MGFSIGDKVFNDRSIFLAPMEDITDQAFRKMCSSFGADLVFTEFVSAGALIRKVNRTMQKISIASNERPVAIQLYGKDPFEMAEAAKVALEAEPEIIDINFGCPVRKIATKGAGAGLLRNIPLMVEITKNVVEAVNVPVTVKTRLGWNEDTKFIKDIALQLQDVGIKALTIHGRTRAQMYTGKSDWTLIKEVKDMPEITIPIIGNGDIVSPEDAMQAFDNYGVDAIMIGRAAIGAPWIFKEISHYLKTGSKTAFFTPKEKIDILKQILDNNCNRTNEYGGILHTRRHLAATPLFRGLDEFRPLRVKMLRSKSRSEIYDILDEIHQTYFC